MTDVPRNPTSQVQVDISSDGVVTTVTVTGEMEVTRATVLTRHLLTVGAAHPGKFVLDLTGLVVVDAAGARALDQTRTLLEHQRPVIVRSPRPSARKVFGRTS